MKVAAITPAALVAGAATVLLGVALVSLRADEQAPAAVAVDADDIGGVVRGPSGPEAGVWVIAETRDLPTPFARIVVTDDQGRYLLPDLPSGNYDVWVRGYGLADSAKTRSARGRVVNLTAAAAANARAAAQIYPTGHWFAMMQAPAASEFPGTGPTGNGIAVGMTTQANYLRTLKSGTCFACHALGTKGTREIPELFRKMGPSEVAWERRLQAGQAGAQMISGLGQLGRERTLRMFADWTDRIAAGEVPATAPARPQGLERNVVVTMWDWADPEAYMHDLVSTDRRNPTINANGPVYGALELSKDYVPVLDPRTHTPSRVPLTVRDPATPMTSQVVLGPSAYWGSRPIWDSKANNHNPMFDQRGRVWLAATVRPAANPAYCREGSSHPSARVFPVNNAGRHVQMYDPTTKKLTHISTCFSTHHVMFAEDANNTLWTSGGGPVIGWINTKMYDETGDEERSQGWTPLIIDTNGNGRRDAWVEPNQPVDPSRDKRYGGSFYAVAPAPDGSVWGSSLGMPGAVIRLVPGNNPTETALIEVYEPPFQNPRAKVQGYGPRGMDIDRNGVAWVALASGHLASFDRRRCTGPLNGPNATGQHCPEGWTLYAEPVPQMRGVTEPGSAGASYYTWVDQFDTFGLGANTPINTGNSADGLLALKDGQWVVLRVPYPTGYYTKWLDGRIDDPNGGWKGRGLWTTISTRAPFHMETGAGTTSKVVRFQLRPNPLAR
jgi:hypothetical protein